MRHLLPFATLLLVIPTGCVAFTDLDQVEDDNRPPEEGGDDQNRPVCRYGRAVLAEADMLPFPCRTEPLGNFVYDLVDVETCVVNDEFGDQPFYADVCDEEYEVSVTVDDVLEGKLDLMEMAIEADFAVEWEFYGSELDECEEGDPRVYTSCNQVETAINTGMLGLSPWRGDWSCDMQREEDGDEACSCTTTSSPPFHLDKDIDDINPVDGLIQTIAGNDDPNIDLTSEYVDFCRPDGDTVEVYGLLTLGAFNPDPNLDNRGGVFVMMRFRR